MVAASTVQPVILPPGIPSDPAPDPLARAYDLPCTLVLDLPVVDFSVGSLLNLEKGSIVSTAAQQNEDLLLEMNGQPVGMVELDVVGDRLAVRITGLA